MEKILAGKLLRKHTTKTTSAPLLAPIKCDPITKTFSEKNKLPSEAKPKKHADKLE